VSQRPRFANLAAKALRLERTASDFVEVHDARAHRIEAIRDAIRQRARRKVRNRLIIAAASVAAAAGAAFVIRSHRAHVEVVAHGADGAAYIEHDGAREPFASGVKVRAGDHLVVNDGARVELSLTTGTQIAVESRGDLSVVAQSRNQIYWLAAGEMQARVAKLKEGERFIVRTLDAEVEVRGTQFHVATAKSDAACGNGSTTRVNVTEGVVTVRHAGTESRIGAGQQWPSGCRTDVPSPAVPEAPRASPPSEPKSEPDLKPELSSARATALPEPRANPNGAPAAPAPSSFKNPNVATSSELAAQNDLFAHATDQKRAGDPRAAIATFDVFLSRYPKSALVESATVERWRLLAQVDRASARAAARDYLVRYPNGFARSDARVLLDRRE